ncbi:hypothetical protein G3O06_07710 [Burkholderia sp. Ac-20345]|uniref:hypothetical protein n=1 Tax=Burkholderia sp. Ac-20345 TaxID=2703891 RepID=UPI00197BBA52|nr:hypothetical protein [Burkholderia sp. Ac-20345]MBN3777436.1 hypothetical protein [Burkholderia sp. Ac-20345]
MKRPNAQQLLAIEQLQSRAQAWEILLEWLGENHVRALAACACADDELAVRRLQGEVRALSGVIDALTAKK